MYVHAEGVHVGVHAEGVHAGGVHTEVYIQKLLLFKSVASIHGHPLY